MAPKYIVFWPVAQLLNFLKSWHPIEDLTLKQLTLKTVALVALSSSDRGQTLNFMRVDRMHASQESIKFVITERLKNTRRSLKPKIVTCPSNAEDSLNVKNYIEAYIEKTSDFRNDYKSLFLSWATKRPITKQTLARWLKLTLSLANIDTSVYSVHSYRGASLSAAYNKGVSFEAIVKAGDWKNVSTFTSHYCAPTSCSPVGQIILNTTQGKT